MNSDDLDKPRYCLSESFYSFQGEGVHMGRAAYFLRLYGCDQKCSFCDSAATWHPGYKPDHLSKLSAHELALQAHRLLPAREPGEDAPFVVLTGGEPALYNLAPLLQALQNHHLRVHIETAGHKPLPASDLDWVTVSPKYFAHPPLDANLARADEIKLIVSSRDQLVQDTVRIALALERQGLGGSRGAGGASRPLPHLWLHPEWSQRENPEVLDAITHYVTRCPAWRAGWQMHKCYRADRLDPNSDKRLIPLGGVVGSTSTERQSS